jgi:DNA-binding beta-propeller fold protein YncE
MSRPFLVVRVLVITAACAVGLAAPAAADVVGQLGQLGGTAGCYSLTGASEVGPGDCTNTRGGDGPSELAISPDGRSAYAVEYDGQRGLLAFSRDTSTGSLTQLAGKDGCLTATGAGEDGADTCTDVRGLVRGGDGRGIAITPDGRFVYVVSQEADSVLAFARDLGTGRLTQLSGTDGCVSRTGAGAPGAPGEGAGTCANGRGLDAPATATLTPDARHLLVFAYSGTEPGLMVFARDADSGRLTQLPGTAGCFTKDGDAEGVADTCTDARSLDQGIGIVVSPDGRNVYTGSTDTAILAFSRDTETGVMTQLPGTQGCISEDGAGEGGAGTCANARSVIQPYHAAIDPTGTHVYFSDVSGAVLAFRRDAESGALTQLPGLDGCLSTDGTSEDGAATCADARGIENPYALVVSADGRNVYVPDSDADTIVSFARDPASGRLTQLEGAPGCISTTGAGAPGEGAGVCADGRGLLSAYSATLSPDDLFLYVPSYQDDVIAVFSRQVPPACSAATAAVAHGGSVTIDLPCRDPNGSAITRTIVSGPGGGTLSVVDQAAGRVTYSARPGFSGRDTFTFRGTDATGEGSTETITVDVAPAGSTPIVMPPPPIVERVDTTPPRCTGRRASAGTARAAQANLAGRTRLRDLLRGRLRLRVRCTEPARLTATLTMRRADARRLRLLQRRPRTVTLGRGTARAAADRPATVSVRLSKRTRARLRRAGLRRLRRVPITLRLVAVDPAGNRSVVTRRVRLRR